MRRPQAVVLLALAAMVLSAVAGCGGKGGTSTQPPTVADGWTKFTAGDYAGAIATFNAVLTDDPSLNDAHNGLGWSYAFDGNLSTAKGEFETAINNDPALTDAHAGLSSVLLAMGDHPGALEQATAVLDADTQWTFSHYSGVDHADVRLIRAQANFAMGSASFASAQSDLDVLFPANGLDPNEASTWNEQPTYAAALLKALQLAEESVGAQMMLHKQA